MNFDAAAIREEMKALESMLAQLDAPHDASVEFVMARLAGLPDELAEQVGMAAFGEMQRVVDELLPRYERMGIKPTPSNRMWVAFLQGMTFKTAIANLQARGDIVQA